MNKIKLLKENKILPLEIPCNDFEVSKGFILINGSVAYVQSLDRGRTFRIIDYPKCEIIDESKAYLMELLGEDEKPIDKAIVQSTEHKGLYPGLMVEARNVLRAELRQKLS